MEPAILALGDGSLFKGKAIGAAGASVGEVVFNTAMTGYQEILTDPSYARQIVTLTYPHIGNTGGNPVDEESGAVHAAGLLVRDVPPVASNFRSEQTLPEYLAERGVVAIADIDTRRLTRILREKGAQSGCLMAGPGLDEKKALALATEFPGLKGMDLAQAVSTKKAYEWGKREKTRRTYEYLGSSGDNPAHNWLQSAWLPTQSPAIAANSLAAHSSPSAEGKPLHVVAYDFGVKRNILRMLEARGCRITVVPARTAATDALAHKPDGVFLSNGPGDPEPCDYAIAAIGELLEASVPIFGICLGHQLLGLASGAHTVKMKFGHHGANHPVQDLADGSVLITSQNHGFAVAEAGLPDCLEITHKSLFDGSLQGIRRRDKPAFGFQGHPEASPGPRDAAPLFDRFIGMMGHTQEGRA